MILAFKPVPRADIFNTADGRESLHPINWKRVDTERGVVVVTTVDPAKYAIPENGWSLFGPECYHVCDYSFFYNNIRQNVADRIAAWFHS